MESFSHRPATQAMQRVVTDWRESCRAVVISLRRSTARAANVQRIIAECPLPCERWDAVDGSALSPVQMEAVYRPKLHRPHYPFQLKTGEIGCYLSHRNIWQQMVDDSIDRLLVLEDDISFLPNFEAALGHAVLNAPDGSYVQFQVRDVPVPVGSASRNGSPTLVRPTVVPLRTSAQLVTLGAAVRLLDFSRHFDRPVDAAIQMTWLHRVDVRMAWPRSVVEVSADIGGSTIGSRKKRRSIWQSLSRQWHRSRYRQAVANRSKHQPTSVSESLDKPFAA